jgi:hypothetical protein
MTTNWEHELASFQHFPPHRATLTDAELAAGRSCFGCGTSFRPDSAVFGVLGGRDGAVFSIDLCQVCVVDVRKRQECARPQTQAH